MSPRRSWSEPIRVDRGAPSAPAGYGSSTDRGPAPGLTDVTSAGHGALVQQLGSENQALRRLFDAQQSLIEQALAGDDVAALVHSIGRLIGRPVHGSGPWISTVNRQLTAQTVARARGDQGSLAGAERRVSSVTVPVVVRGEIVGQLAVDGPRQAIGEDERLVLRYGAHLIGLLLQRTDAAPTPPWCARAELLRDLLVGSEPPGERLLARGYALGCDLAKASLLLVGRTQRPRLNSDDEAERALADVVVAAAPGMSSLAACHDGRVVVLLLAMQVPTLHTLPWGPLIPTAPALAQREMENVGQAPSSGGEGGLPVADALRCWLNRQESGRATIVVGAVDSTPDLPGRYQACIRSLTIAQRLSMLGVVGETDRQLRSYQVLAGGADPELAVAFADDVLGNLERHDARHGGALVATLAAFLGHNGNLPATAAALHLHVNSLKYRLGRITTLSGLRLRDPNDGFYAQLALRLRRLGIGAALSESDEAAPDLSAAPDNWQAAERPVAWLHGRESTFD